MFAVAREEGEKNGESRIGKSVAYPKETIESQQ